MNRKHKETNTNYRERESGDWRVMSTKCETRRVNKKSFATVIPAPRKSVKRMAFESLLNKDSKLVEEKFFVNSNGRSQLWKLITQAKGYSGKSNNLTACQEQTSSKFKPSPQEEHHLSFNHVVQDKTTPPIPIPTLYSSTKISPSPPSPTSSTCSFSSFACTTSNTTTSSSSSSSSLSATSSSSSSFTSKDRSFSNDFLWSCYKDNPHIITRINEPSLPTKPIPKANVNVNPSSPKPNFMVTTLKQSPTQSLSVPHKRLRSNSPTNLTRQKSFRKDTTERSVTINYSSNMQSRTSPSRRFNGSDRSASASSLAATVTDTRRKMVNSSKVSVGAAHSHHSVSPSTRKENVKGATPNNCNSRRVVHSGLRHTENCIVGVGSKIDETVVKDVLSDHDMDLTLMEDLHNPLISLDCFIFL
ncbi:hypothetical protein Fmac_007658 [Flemingia macrophylla]|uniref:Uncharacterized protein n=1 Tax=Flemingia macrophylla TaxID=520843 RepID=A0ABD1MV67_9FABA